MRCLWEQDQIIACGQTRDHLVTFATGRALVATDKDRAPDFRDKAHDGPALDIALGDKHRIDLGTQNRNIEPG